jgi:hypothetical protein
LNDPVQFAWSVGDRISASPQAAEAGRNGRTDTTGLPTGQARELARRSGLGVGKAGFGENKGPLTFAISGGKITSAAYSFKTVGYGCPRCDLADRRHVQSSP